MTITATLDSITNFGAPVASLDKCGMGALVAISVDLVLSGNKPDSSAFTLESAQFWYNPAMFVDLGVSFSPFGGQPSTGFLWNLPGSPSGNYNGALQAGAATSSQYAGTCVLNVTSNTTATITHTFYVTADVDAFIQGVVLANNSRLTRNAFANIIQFNNGQPSVFNYTKAYKGYTYISQGGFGQYVEFSESASLKWYDRNTLDAPSDITNPVQTITRDSDSAVVTSINVAEAHTIEFTCDHPFVGDDGVNLRAGFFKLVGGNSGNWLVQTEYDFTNITTNGATSQLAGPIWSPTTFSYTGSDLVGTFKVPANALTDGEQYYIIYTVGNGAWETWPLIFPVFTGGLPLPLDLDDFIGISYANGNEGGIDVVSATVNGSNEINVSPEAQCKTGIWIDVAAYEAALAASVVNGVDFATDCRKLTLQILDATDTELWKWEGVKANGQTVFNWTSAPLELDEGTLQVWWLTRPRWLNEQGLLDMAAYPPATDNSFKIRLTARFEYLNPDWAANYILEGALNVLRYDNDETTPILLPLGFFDADTGLPVNNLCDVDTLLVKVQTVDDSSWAPEASITASVDHEPFGAPFNSDGQLSETRNWTDVDPVVAIPTSTGEPQNLGTNMIVQPDDTGLATFTVDVSDLPENARLLIHVNLKEV